MKNLNKTAVIGKFDINTGIARAIILSTGGEKEHAGKILKECFSEPDRIEELIGLGELSTLGRGLTVEDGTIAVHRDQGKPVLRILHWDLLGALVRDIELGYRDSMVYLHLSGSWSVYDFEQKCFVEY